MADVMEEQREEVEPAEQPHDVANPAAAPAPEPTVDDILSEFDKATAPQPTPDPGHADALDEILASFGDTTKIDAQNEVVSSLRGEVAALREAEFQRAEMAAFDKVSSDLQTHCANAANVPEDYARTQLLSMLVERPELKQVWSYRNLSDADRQACDTEFRQLEYRYNQVMRAPDSPEKQQALSQMYRRGQELGLMMNTPKIMQQVRNEVVGRARKVPPMIDVEATQTRFDIAQAMRGASAKIQSEPPPQLGRLTSQEYRKFVRENYGFDAGI
jgi:hypothetical protein